MPPQHLEERNRLTSMKRFFRNPHDRKVFDKMDKKQTMVSNHSLDQTLNRRQ